MERGIKKEKWGNLKGPTGYRPASNSILSRSGSAWPFRVRLVCVSYPSYLELIAETVPTGEGEKEGKDFRSANLEKEYLHEGKKALTLTQTENKFLNEYRTGLYYLSFN